MDMLFAGIGVAILAWLTHQFFDVYANESLKTRQRARRLWLIGGTMIITVTAVLATIFIV